jgi:cell division protein FtsQ
MTTYKQTTPRSDFIRQRRTGSTPRQARDTASKQPAAKTNTRRLSTTASLLLPVEPRPKPKPRQARAATGARVNSGSRKRYDMAFTISNTHVRTPGITLPHIEFSSRWISAALTAALIFALYMMWTSSTFNVTVPELSGNQRLSSNDINTITQTIGKPIFQVFPAQIEATLRAAYPDLSSVSVQVALPNRIIIDVVERTPALAWYQNGAMAWIDPSGVAFPARGAADGLINVVANGTPPQVPDDTAAAYERVYVQPQMVQGFKDLYPYVPAGTPMVYDPQYGIGWQDPRGWQIFFGESMDNLPLKVQAYQAIVDMLTLKGVQPTLISVAYLDAPFYR